MSELAKAFEKLKDACQRAIEWVKSLFWRVRDIIKQTTAWATWAGFVRVKNHTARRHLGRAIRQNRYEQWRQYVTSNRVVLARSR